MFYDFKKLEKLIKEQKEMNIEKIDYKEKYEKLVEVLFESREYYRLHALRATLKSGGTSEETRFACERFSVVNRLIVNLGLGDEK